MDDLNERYVELGMAVVEKAAIDYHNARFVIDTIDERSLNAEDKDRVLLNANRDIVDVDKFMHSGWFETLSNLDGPRAFKALQETYENEMKFDIAERFYNLNKENPILKGYPTSSGYKGWTKNGWMLFETEGAYKEYMED